MLRTIWLVVFVCLSLSSHTPAADWPQWAGPNRDFTAGDADLADHWPADGPRRLWSRAVMHCHDRKSGKVLWMRDLAEEFGATHAGRKNNDTGYPPSPIAYKNSVIVPLGRSRVKAAEPGRSLVALDQTDGRVLWTQLDFEYGLG
jgi:hypothetical protein